MRRDDVPKILDMTSASFDVPTEWLFSLERLPASARAHVEAAEDAVIYALHVVSSVELSSIGRFLLPGIEPGARIVRCLRERKVNRTYDARVANLAFAITHYWLTGKTTGVRLAA